MQGLGTYLWKANVSGHLEGPPAAGSIAQGTREHGDGDQNHIFLLRSCSIQFRACTGYQNPPP
jgi:hypothetical protein